MNGRKEHPPVRQPSLMLPILLTLVCLTALTYSATVIVNAMWGAL